MPAKKTAAAAETETKETVKKTAAKKTTATKKTAAAKKTTAASATDTETKTTAKKAAAKKTTAAKKTGPAIVQKAVSQSLSNIGWIKVKRIPTIKIISTKQTIVLVNALFLKTTNGRSISVRFLKNGNAPTKKRYGKQVETLAISVKMV